MSDSPYLPRAEGTVWQLLATTGSSGQSDCEIVLNQLAPGGWVIVAVVKNGGAELTDTTTVYQHVYLVSHLHDKVKIQLVTDDEAPGNNLGRIVVGSGKLIAGRGGHAHSEIRGMKIW